MAIYDLDWRVMPEGEWFLRKIVGNYKGISTIYVYTDNDAFGTLGTATYTLTSVTDCQPVHVQENIKFRKIRLRFEGTTPIVRDVFLDVRAVKEID